MKEEQLIEALRAGPSDEADYGGAAIRRPRPTFIPNVSVRPAAKPANWVWPSVAATVALAVLLALVRPLPAEPGMSVGGTPPESTTAQGSPSQPATALELVLRSGRLRVGIATRGTGISDALRSYQLGVASGLAGRLNLELELVQVPATSILTTVDVDWDVAFGPRSLGRSHRFVESSAYLNVPRLIVVPAKAAVTSIDQLAGRSICVSRISNGEAWLRQDLSFQLQPATVIAPPPSGARPLVLDDDLGCLAAIRAGRAAAMVTDQLTATDVAREPDVLALADPVYTEPLALSAPAHGPNDIRGLIARVDELLRQMSRDGTLSAQSRAAFGGLDLSVPPAG
jgi:ABC-type amino acid transport substrate-binding protein